MIDSKQNEIQMALLKTLFEELKVRDSAFWRLARHSVITIVVLLIVPFYYGKDIAAVKTYAIVFPIITFLISPLVIWLLLAQAYRQTFSSSRYYALRDRLFADFCPDEEKRLVRIDASHLKLSLAKVLAWSIGAISFIASIIAIGAIWFSV